jgi:dihydrofolate synthase / folylpolyglutamate synthase
LTVHYRESITYLRTLSDMERDPAQAFAPANFQLSRVESLLSRLGSPHLGRPTIHIAGSKGKGSTAAMIASILQTQGESTGLYTSPHLHRYEERIAVDGHTITAERFAESAGRVRPAVDAEANDGSSGQPSTFEALTAMAFLAFQDAGCTVQVLEVGLGGRLDATNVDVGEKLCVLTPIGLEHTAILGDSVPAIAAEKAAIIQPDSRVVMAPQRESAAAVIRARCQEVGAELHEVAQEAKMRPGSLTLDGRDLALVTPRDRYDARLPVLGRRQCDNAAAAILACELFSPELTTAAVRRGLAALRLPGRQELIRRRPHVLVDVAHSEDSIRALVNTLEELGQSSVVLVFAALADKRIREMASLLAPSCAEVIATTAPHPRAAQVEEVAGALRDAGAMVSQVPDMELALDLALDAAGDRGWLVVAGSFAAAAAAREKILALAPAL